MRGDVDRNPIALEPIEECRDSDAGRIDGSAIFRLGDQARAFDLRLSLGAGEGMPPALALAGLWFTHVDDNCPVAGRAFAKMPSHFGSSPLGGDSCLLLLNSVA